IADVQMAGLYRYADDLFDPDGRGPDARELLDHRPQGASHSARLRPDVDGELIAACGDAAVWNHLLDLDQRDHRAWAARPGISRRLDRAICVLHQQRARRDHWRARERRHAQRSAVEARGPRDAVAPGWGNLLLPLLPRGGPERGPGGLFPPPFVS